MVGGVEEIGERLDGLERPLGSPYEFKSEFLVGSCL